MPARNLETIACRDATELAATAAAQWLALLASQASQASPFTVALSGGRITEAFFREVVKQTGACSAAFAQVHFFWADERCVPPTDAQSNFRLADELLLRPLGIPTERIHRLCGEDDPLTAARAAEAELRPVCRDAQDGQPVLDLIFLGMGEDGHVASLFPHEPEAMSQNTAVYRAVFDSPKPPPQRLTMGYRALAAAREVWVLAAGKGKEAALLASLEDGGRTPLGRVIGMRQRTRLFTDIDLDGRLRE